MPVGGDLFQGGPELVFQAHAGLVLADHDRSFGHYGSHDSLHWTLLKARTQPAMVPVIRHREMASLRPPGSGGSRISASSASHVRVEMLRARFSASLDGLDKFR